MNELAKCPTCDEWWVNCPCCSSSFCPRCEMFEEDANLKVEAENHETD